MAILALCSAAFAQRFKSATVTAAKTASEATSIRSGMTGRMTIRNASLKDCIAWAFGLSGALIDGNAQLFPDKFDIEARSGGPPSATQYRKMLQALLGESFQLKVHREVRSAPAWRLAVADGGPRLQKTSGGKAQYHADRKTFSGENISMAELAVRLTGLLNRPVVDATGVTGAFNLKVGWPQEELKMRSDNTPHRFFKALREQAGLTLTDSETPVEMLVVDHAERPKP